MSDDEGPDTGLPDPGLPDPGLPDPGLPDPGLPDPGLPDYELADLLPVEGEEQIKALAEPLRLLVLDLVLEKAMTVTELAEATGRAKGTVAHHVDVLVRAGLLKVVRTRKVRAVVESFYGRTARTIVFSRGQEADAGLSVFVRQAEREYSPHHEGVLAQFTLRHARIPPERAAEFFERVVALAVEFTQLPREGDQEWGFLAGVYPTDRLTTTTRRRRR